MGTKELKSLGGTAAMIVVIVGVGFFARSATAEQQAEAVEQPPVDTGATLASVSPRDIPTSVINNDPTDESSDTTEDQDESTSESPVPEPDTAQATQEPSEETSDEPAEVLEISFEKVQSTQDDSTVTVVSKTNEASLDGLCVFTFSLGGSSFQEATQSSQTRCSVLLPAASFSSSGDWTVSHTYTSRDGSVAGVGGPYSLTVTIETPEPTLTFIKGGAEQDDDTLRIISWLSDAASGECSFAVSDDQGIVTGTSRSIADARICSTNIPLANLPASGTYTVVISFESEGGQVVAADPLAIDISL